MVSRVPLLGMVLAMALLVGENLGANAYVAAKQREADRQSLREAITAQQRADVDRLIAEIQRRQHEIEQIGTPYRPTKVQLEMIRGELAQKQLEIERMHLEAEKLRREH